jgi:hypothetical protein
MFLARASLSVITPCDVDTIEIPSPFKTLGNSFDPAYFLSPGRLARLMLLIAGTLFPGDTSGLS